MNHFRRLLIPTLLLLVGLLIGRITHPVLGLEVTFENVSTTPIESIQLDFGSADTQSTIRTFRIAPGQARTLALNHSPGMGFNVQVRYADGQTREFCALRGDEQTRPVLELRP